MTRAIADDALPRFTFSNGLLSLLGKITSNHIKHVFFIASLHAQFNHYNQHRRMAMMATKKLNEVIDLAYRPDAMDLPALLHDKVWGKTGLEEVLTESAIVNATTSDDVVMLARKVISISPPWSRYGTEEEMVEDTSTWIRSQHEHLLEAA
jgi:hypothetical protein